VELRRADGAALSVMLAATIPVSTSVLPARGLTLVAEGYEAPAPVEAA